MAGWRPGLLNISYGPAGSFPRISEEENGHSTGDALGASPEHLTDAPHLTRTHCSVLFLEMLLELAHSNSLQAEHYPPPCLPEVSRKSSRGEANKILQETTTRFLLFEEAADKDCQVLLHHPNTLQECGFNASLPLVMIIHGWSVDGLLENWVSQLVAALKSGLSQQVNVGVANWMSLALNHYAIAARNTRLVGQEIAAFLRWLEESVQFSRSNVHLIGYSLGAHVAGFAGSYIGGTHKIGRITGLDAAGPLFEGISPSDRLSPDDAKFVDAIHTFTKEHMGLSVGIKDPVAHYDFYPNGGSFQPGCHFLELYKHIAKHGLNAITKTIKCSHERSVHLFIDSLLHSSMPSTAYLCSNMDSFSQGLCLSCKKGQCNTLGYHIRQDRPSKSRTLYLVTRAQAPFKVYHYQFKMQFINQLEKRVEPTFTVSLLGTKGEMHNIPITLGEGITSNKTYSFLITLHFDIGELVKIKFKWESSAIWANVWNTVQTIIPWSTGPRNSGLLLKIIKAKAGETQKRMAFCSENMEDLQLHPNQEKSFVKCEVKSKKRKLKIR
ncbi:PREDICTED: hepatic triacylglycerol lipase [Elephantulus edwardii]|uniref:hepatic triacylglycerol lipase n=1 Tax=Elephantulus edwardii TaxID=28737 RepID=UPI0003F0C4F6|nr:PREDICTED: hepatic triacylglycerol lipase [Elephantulus edwardii]